LFVVWERQWAIAWDRRWCLTFWSFVLTAVPWYAWVGIETKGEFLSGFLWKHNLERGTSAMENHHGFPGYYLVILIVGTTPWSIFLAGACWFGMWSAIRSPWKWCENWWTRAAEDRLEQTIPNPTDETAAYRLLWCWVLIYIVFFSIAATKLPNYVLPVIVPCTILIARFLQRWRMELIAVPGWLVHASVLGLLIFGVFASLGLSIAGGVGELTLLRGRFFPGLETWAILGLAPIAASAACWWFARTRQYSRYITAVAVCALVFLGPMAAFGSMVFNGYKAPRPLVELTDAQRQDEDIRIGCWQIEHLPSLNFYVKRNVEHLHDENALKNFMQARLPVYLFIPANDWDRLQSMVSVPTRVIGRQHDMYHHTDVLVVTNR
jgi:4-amino-4-deoxy-L-arabinose transferase-like glycosyltransferase